MLNFYEELKRRGMSERQLDVVAYLCRGMSDAEIGEKLFIAEDSVKIHVQNIMRKMKVNNRHKLLVVLDAVMGEIIYQRKFEAQKYREHGNGD